MRYDGLDIQQITIGSACGFMMRNNYEYDGLHRLTETKNVFFAPQPYPDAFSNTYTYDRAGNIQTLMRRGIINMGPGNTPESDTIDVLNYVYGDSLTESSILAKVRDMAGNPVAQPLGLAATLSTYGHDGNGNMTLAGPVTAEYNIMNLPTKLTTDAGTRHFAYVYGEGKYRARIETTPGSNPIEETRHYLGGMEFKDGKPENYNFGDGRIVYSDSLPPGPQFRLHDHLGNTVVFFEDKDLNGCITTEADTISDPEELEILQRLWYYPFGMQMENISQWGTAPEQWYRYNGKERDTLSGWYDYGARWYDAGIGRWNGVDPMASKYANISPYAYVANDPIKYIDVDGKELVLPSWLTRFGLDLQRDINLIYRSNLGKSLIRDLEASPIKFLHKDAGEFYLSDNKDVKNSKTRGDYPNYWEAKDGIVTISYAQRADIKVDGVLAYSFLVLAHEYVHARDIATGILSELYDEMKAQGIKIPKERIENELAETRALIFTNALSKEQGIDNIRTHYKGVRLVEDDGVTPVVNYGVNIVRGLFDSPEKKQK